MNLKFSKVAKITFPTLMVFVLVFSVISVSYAEVVKPTVSPVEVSPASVRSTLRPLIKASVSKAIVPIGRFDEDSKSFPVSPSVVGDCSYFADFNRDGVVDTRDMIAYLNAWAAKDLSADTNRDGVVNTADYRLFTSQWKICRSSECFVSDFNKDGLIDTRDMIAFLNAWTDRDISADVNNDGRVSGMDFVDFFNMWRKCNV